MYGILTGVTIILLISSITPAIMLPDYTKLTKNGKLLLTLTLTGTVALLWFTFFATTTTILSQTPDAKHSKQPWRVIYKNDIKADIKIESCSGRLTPVTPKDVVSKNDFNQFMQGLPIPGINTDEANINITAKNDVDETTKEVTLPKDNIIETWPKGMKPNKSKGHITKIEYRSTPVTRKWFTIPVDKTNYKEIRITVEYEGQKRSIDQATLRRRLERKIYVRNINVTHTDCIYCDR